MSPVMGKKRWTLPVPECLTSYSLISGCPRWMEKELMEHLKGDPSLSHVPVIAVTASVMKEEEEQLRGICDGFIKKPVSKAELVGTLMTFLPHEELDTVEQVESGTSLDWSPEQMTDLERDQLPELLSFVESQSKQ